VIEKIKTIFLYIDGMRYDYIKRMPFLNDYANHYFNCPVDIEPLHQFEFSIFTSQHQYSHNLWSWYALAADIDESPFSWLRYIHSYIPNGPKTRNLITYINAGLQLLKKQTRFVKIGSIPYEVALQLTTTAKKSFIDHRPTCVKTMFDVLHEYDWNFFLIEWPICSTNKRIYLNPLLRKSSNMFSELKKKKDKDFVFAHFVELDNKMHSYGIDTAQVYRELSNLDNGLENYIEFLEREIKDYNLIICSDHGMAKTVGTINVASILQNKRFLAFPDSTTLRLWCNSLDDIELGCELLEELPNGHVYGKDDFAEIGITYSRRFTGDLMFISDIGYIITPNYFDGENIPKAMHGFLPSKELEACFVINTRNINDVNRIEMVDICPTTLESMNIPIPSNWQGKSHIC
jgi:hypothetical protein|tara:strand:+ start:863 stop:2071 length:1209 start_codon:yes stop_codon:yes gene_type:complete